MKKYLQYCTMDSSTFSEIEIKYSGIYKILRRRLKFNVRNKTENMDKGLHPHRHRQFLHLCRVSDDASDPTFVRPGNRCKRPLDRHRRRHIHILCAPHPSDGGQDARYERTGPPPADRTATI